MKHALLHCPLSLLLSLLLCLAFLPMDACAAETELPDADPAEVLCIDADENPLPHPEMDEADDAESPEPVLDETADTDVEVDASEDAEASDFAAVNLMAEDMEEVSMEETGDDAPETKALPEEEVEDAAVEESMLSGGEEHPVIAMTYVPVYGEQHLLSGVVFNEDGSPIDPNAWNISVFVQIDKGGQAWRKPTDAQPCTAIGANGAFNALFITGGSDQNAVTIHVMLIPAGYTPVNLSDTAAVALDHVVIDRTTEGVNTLTPDRTAPDLSDKTVLPVSQDKLALNIGFHIDGTWPDTGLSEALIRRQLDAVSGFTDTVRFYASGGETQPAYKIAHDMGLAVVGTAELKKDADSANRAELDALIDNCNCGYVQLACVGNETLYEGDLTEAELIDCIQYVRGRLSDKTIPVTTSDTLGVLLNRPDLLKACDVVFPNVYPYWNGTAIGGAAEDFSAELDNLATVCGGKQIIVSETGWPDQGGSKGAAVASGANVTAYFNAVRKWSLDNRVQVFWFAGADEPWKASNESEVGVHWGILTRDLKRKDCYTKTAFFQARDPKLTVSAGTSLIAGKTLTVKATARCPVTFKSGNTKIATVDKTGKVKGIAPGTVSITVTAKGSGYDTAQKTVKIKVSYATPAISKVQNVNGGVKLTWGKVTGAVKYRVYCKVGNGAWQSVGVTTSTTFTAKTSDGKTALKHGTKYTFTVKCVASDGKTATSGYSKSGKTLLYLSAPALSKVSSPKAKTLTASWGKRAGVTGYQVQYSTSKTFSGGKSVTVKGALSRTIGSLSKGKTYYVRLRCYKTVSGKNVYSGWSAAKTVKIK